MHLVFFNEKNVSKDVSKVSREPYEINKNDLSSWESKSASTILKPKRDKPLEVRGGEKRHAVLCIKRKSFSTSNSENHEH